MAKTAYLKVVLPLKNSTKLTLGWVPMEVHHTQNSANLVAVVFKNTPKEYYDIVAPSKLPHLYTEPTEDKPLFQSYEDMIEVVRTKAEKHKDDLEETFTFVEYFNQ